MRRLSERIGQRILEEARDQRLLEAAYEQLTLEIEELIKLTAEAAEVPYGNLVDRALLGGDDETRDEIRACFERNQAPGRFPLLSKYLADLPDEKKEEFFRAGWLTAYGGV